MVVEVEVDEDVEVEAEEDVVADTVVVARTFTCCDDPPHAAAVTHNAATHAPAVTRPALILICIGATLGAQRSRRQGPRTGFDQIRSGTTTARPVSSPWSRRR